MSSELKITVLVEDTVNRRDLFAEHGLSLWIEYGDKKILFDTGQSDLLIKNAYKMDIDLKKTDAILLSHGHYDHIGGLRYVMSLVPQAKIFAHKAAFDKKYARNADGTSRPGGVENVDMQQVIQRADFIDVNKPVEVCDGFYLTGPIPRLTDFEDVGGPFFKDEACNIADDLPDDQAAFIVTDAGTVVILGCAHAGVINTLRYIQQLTNYSPIKTVIGGMHLVNADDKRIERTIYELKEIGIEELLPCHCTGIKGMTKLWNEFTDKCKLCSVGTKIDLSHNIEAK